MSAGSQDLSERLSMLLEVAVDEPSAPGMSRAQYVALLRQRSQDAKQRLLPRIEALRSRDPKLQIRLQGSIFPVLEIETTQEVFDALASDPDVVHIYPSGVCQLDLQADGAFRF